MKLSRNFSFSRAVYTWECSPKITLSYFIQLYLYSSGLSNIDVDCINTEVRFCNTQQLGVLHLLTIGRPQSSSWSIFTSHHFIRTSFRLWGSFEPSKRKTVRLYHLPTTVHGYHLYLGMVLRLDPLRAAASFVLILITYMLHSVL